MENFLTVASQVAVLFVLMGAGIAMRRMRLIGDGAVDGMVNMLMFVVTPCVIVDCFQRPFDSSMLSGLGLAFVIAVAGHLAIIAIARLLVRPRDDDVGRTLQLAAVFSNAGFMGIPLEQAILGPKGVFYGVVYVVVFNLFIWTWGVARMEKGRRKKGEGRSVEPSGVGVWKMVANPGTVGIALGLPFFLLSARLPPVMATSVHHVANLNTPMAMIVIGYSLAGAKFGRVAKMGSVYLASGLRLVVHPLVMVAALAPFAARLDRDMVLALVIASSAPVAAMVAMFASKFRRDVDVGVAVVSATTLASIVTMPPVIAFAMHVFK